MQHDPEVLATGMIALLTDDHYRDLELVPGADAEPARRVRAGELRDDIRDLRLRLRAGRASLGPVTCALLRMEPPRVKPSHFRRAGANAKLAGRSFEDEIEASNRAYSRDGLAAMARAHPPVGGPPRALFYKGKGQVDFVGNVCGIPVAFDVKTEAGAASYKHDVDEMHELDFLLDWRAKGGVAFLLLLDRERDQLYLVENIQALREGASVPMREHVRAKTGAQAVVPALVRTESQRALDAAMGFPIWPWIDLARQHEPRLATAIAEHLSRRSA